MSDEHTDDEPLFRRIDGRPDIRPTYLSLLPAKEERLRLAREVFAEASGLRCVPMKGLHRVAFADGESFKRRRTEVSVAVPLGSVVNGTVLNGAALREGFLNAVKEIAKTIKTESIRDGLSIARFNDYSPNVSMVGEGSPHFDDETDTICFSVYAYYFLVPSVDEEEEEEAGDDEPSDDRRPAPTQDAATPAGPPAPEPTTEHNGCARCRGPASGWTKGVRGNRVRTCAPCKPMIDFVAGDRSIVEMTPPRMEAFEQYAVAAAVLIAAQRDADVAKKKIDASLAVHKQRWTTALATLNQQLEPPEPEPE